MDYDYKILFISFVTGSVGAFARIFSEKDKGKISISRIIFIYLTSIVTSYGAYEATGFWGGRKIIGIISIIAGMVSVDIVHIIITKVPSAIAQLPQILVEMIRIKAGVNNTKKREDESV
ncbi:MAG: hypothetical protein QM499_00985 [Flavobacteriaceae bacterium]